MHVVSVIINSAPQGKLHHTSFTPGWYNSRTWSQLFISLMLKNKLYFPSSLFLFLNTISIFYNTTVTWTCIFQRPAGDSELKVFLPHHLSHIIPALVISHTLITHLKAKIPSSLCQSSLSTAFWWPHTLLQSIPALETMSIEQDQKILHWNYCVQPWKKYICFQVNVLTQVSKESAVTYIY